MPLSLSEGANAQAIKTVWHQFQEIEIQQEINIYKLFFNIFFYGKREERIELSREQTQWRRSWGYQIP